MTWDKLLAEMNVNIKTPGMANIFWMPIQTRTEMLTTGFRSALGIKVFGPDLRAIQNLAVQIEKALADFPDTRSAFAERTAGGYFLDFTVNREAAARYGLTAGDVNDIVETAIGGKTITTTVEGRERYPVKRVMPGFPAGPRCAETRVDSNADGRADSRFHCVADIQLSNWPAVHPQ